MVQAVFFTAGRRAREPAKATVDFCLDISISCIQKNHADGYFLHSATPGPPGPGRNLAFRPSYMQVMAMALIKPFRGRGLLHCITPIGQGFQGMYRSKSKYNFSIF